MDECFKCGVEGEKVRLFDGISREGVVKICLDCLNSEDIPLIKKPTSSQLLDSERKTTLNGIRESHHPVKADMSERDMTLRDIVDKNFEKKIPVEKKPRSDMIEHFHWVLMRARRKKKLTQQQLAREIAEAEAAIKMAEQGILPEDDFRLVNKLESFLGVNIRKKKTREDFYEEALEERSLPKRVDFDPKAPQNLTISDLQKMKREKEKNIFSKKEVDEEKVEEDIEEEPVTDEVDVSEKKEDKDLSEEEMNKLIFGK
jgi:ribosome-binding protein aMBF1 (putative translation factor)